MSEVFIVRRGGGTALFAAIGVTYPAGSTVTCTNGTTTLKAKTTSGQWVFAIPKAGAWTVSATDGTSTASQSVTISNEGQFATIALNYELYLFKGTTDVSAASGGWELWTGTGTLTTEDGVMTMSAAKGSGTTVKDGQYRHKKAFNASDYSTVTVETGSISAYVNSRCQIRVCDAEQNILATVTLKQGTTSYSLDISELSGECYVVFRVRSYWDGSTHVAASLSVKEVKLFN